MRNFICRDLCDPVGVGGGGMCLSAGGSSRGSTTLRLLLRETPYGVFFYFVVGKTHEPCNFTCVSLMAERTQHAVSLHCFSFVVEWARHAVPIHCVCFICFGEGNKMGIFALKNVGVVDFVVWIFFCKFVGCV